MDKMMLIGKTGCGKTTLTQVLHDEDISYKKTQSMIYNKSIIDTPGEYIENRALYRALIVSSADCDAIALVQDCTELDSIFPPNFSSVFVKPVIGIITKIDLCEEEKSIERAEKLLIDAGVQKVFRISSLKNNGIDEVRGFLERK